MMGRREGGQGQFFHSFNLDKVVPADHLVRQIDGVLDAEGTRVNRIAEIAVTQTMVERVRPPLRSSTAKACRRHRLWRGQAAQVADGSQDHTARSGVGQVGAPRRHLQPRRLCLRVQSAFKFARRMTPNQGVSDSPCWLGWRPASMGKLYSEDLRKRRRPNSSGLRSARPLDGCDGCERPAAWRWARWAVTAPW